MLCLKKSETDVGHEVSTTCGSGWVAFLGYEMPIIDPPATAGGTDFSFVDRL